VLEIILGALESSKTNQTYQLKTTCERPVPLNTVALSQAK